MLRELMRRRVPQLAGVYVGATWLVIELGDWVTDRFGLPANLTSFVFIAMLAMLPAVLLFAYNHGAPGRDSWTKVEKWFIPLNAVLAVTVTYLASPFLAVEAATETLRIADESGEIQEYEVPREGFHKEVTAFFWQNESGDPELDWLSYGLPLLLAHDLNRISPLIDVDTPFDSKAVRDGLNNRGYASLLDAPDGLRIQIARDRHSAAVVTGRFSAEGDTLSIHLTVVDAESGQDIGEHSVTGNDWLTAIDDASRATLDYLDIDTREADGDEPVSRHFSGSIDAIRHYTGSQLALDIDNDYPRAIGELEQAIELDPEFAEALGELSTTYYLSGDVQRARDTAAAALRREYRLSQASRFIIKANQYVFDGDYASGERVVDIWAQVQPNSTQAFATMAQLAILRGGTEALAKADRALDRLLELEPTNIAIWLNKAEVEQQRGDLEAAVAHLNNYLEQEPGSVPALLRLATLQQARGELDAAQETLEDAVILASDPLQVEIALARLEARRGMFAAANGRIREQLGNDLTAQQAVQALAVQVELALVTGHIERALELHAELVDVAEAVLPPMLRLVSLEGQRPALLVLLGRNAEAIERADAVRAQLQAPLDAYMPVIYTSIYAESGNREAFRRWVEETRSVSGQLPEFYGPFIAIDEAQLAIWEGDPEAAIRHLGRAQSLLSQSFFQVLQESLSAAAIHTRLANLYLQSGAVDAAREVADSLLKVFPAQAEAKLVLAKAAVREDDHQTARRYLDEALEIWSDADAAYLRRIEAERLHDKLDAMAAP